MSRGLFCYPCAIDERRVSGAVGVGRSGEPACKRHAVRRTPARSRGVALRRVATSDRRSRAAHLRFLGDLRAALGRRDVSYGDVAEVLDVTRPVVVKYRQQAERDRAIS